MLLARKKAWRMHGGKVSFQQFATSAFVQVVPQNNCALSDGAMRTTSSHVLLGKVTP